MVKKGVPPWVFSLIGLVGYFCLFYYLGTYAKPYCVEHPSAWSCRRELPPTKAEMDHAHAKVEAWVASINRRETK